MIASSSFEVPSERSQHKKYKKDNPLLITPRGLTSKQAATLYGLSISGFYKARREGKIPAPTLPGKRYDLDLLYNAMNSLSGISNGEETMTPLERWRTKRAHSSEGN
jgi:hypothetical protein